MLEEKLEKLNLPVLLTKKWKAGELGVVKIHSGVVVLPLESKEEMKEINSKRSE